MAARSLYDYVPHHRTKEKLDHVARPVKVSEQLPHGNLAARFNSWFAVKVTNGVGTMWCAYAFAALAFVARDDVSLHATGMGDSTAERCVIAGQGSRAVRFEPGKECGIAQRAIFHDFSISGPHLPRRECGQTCDIGDDETGLMEQADEILAVARVDSGLAAN